MLQVDDVHEYRQAFTINKRMLSLNISPFPASSILYADSSVNIAAAEAGKEI